jgi:hypothetical protein
VGSNPAAPMGERRRKYLHGAPFWIERDDRYPSRRMALLDHTPKGTTVVTSESFAAALEDPEAKRLVDESLAYFEKIQHEGRDHSVPPFLLGERS